MTVAFSNGSDTTCEFMTSHISAHHTKSSSSGRICTSISGPPLAAYSRSTRCRKGLKYPPTTFLTSVVSVLESTRDSPFGSHHQRPFEYILAISRLRGRPRRETVLPVSSALESESESEFEWDDLVENSNTDNSVFNPGPRQATTR